MAEPNPSEDELLPGFADADPEYYNVFTDVAKRLVNTISIIAAYDCPVHDPRSLCACPTAMAPITPKCSDLFIDISFVQEWKQHLLRHDACFRFLNDKAGKKAFRSAQGLSPYEFAKGFAEETFAAPAMCAPKHGIDTTIGAMFTYWSDQAADWRKDYIGPNEARRVEGACQPGDPEFGRFYRDLSENDPFYPPQIGKRLRLQRMRLGTLDGLHKTTLYFLPLRNTMRHGVEGPMYMILGARPCHENCDTFKLVLTRKVFRAAMEKLCGFDPEAVLVDAVPDSA